MLPRHLPALGLPHDIVAHRDQNCAYIVVQRRHVFDQRACKRRVSSCPIEGYVPWLGREADEGADPGFSRRKASPDVCGARTQGAREIACKRIIPAGVDEQDVGRRLALHGPLHEIEAFRASIVDGVLIYEFTLSLPQPVDPGAADLAVGVYVPEYYVELLLDEHEPVRFAGLPGGVCTFDIREDTEHPIDYGMVYPLAITLACGTS